jgi:hypothetical protein
MENSTVVPKVFVHRRRGRPRCGEFDNLDVYVRPLIYIIYTLATIILVFDHLDVYVRPTI